MISDFREKIARSLSSETQLTDALNGMVAADWAGVAELFAAKLPEFDAAYALPGAEELTSQIARIRGIKDCAGSGFPAGSGQLVIFASQFQKGEDAQQIIQSAQAAGWQVPLVGVAVERTTKGGRTLLGTLGAQVRAVVQLADTPNGLVFERRTSDRWEN